MLCSYEKKGVSIFEVYSDEKHKFADGVIFALDRWRIGTYVFAVSLSSMFHSLKTINCKNRPSILITIVSLSALGCVTDQRFQQLCQFML
ncbi:uncharacterized protein LOC110874211 isoform X2 [Helianthus annuus]|uniref:uncharacterized protein LOC110874211 isoform X2 n=1 Tax=Helianthus annuus TaxID=4232 RepID=UPI000B8F88FA|nr:uncharacterized protein LOC110874211 isoform X2 [Helianthus annuus]